MADYGLPGSDWLIHWLRRTDLSLRQIGPVPEVGCKHGEPPSGGYGNKMSPLAAAIGLRPGCALIAPFAPAWLQDYATRASLFAACLRLRFALGRQRSYCL